VRDVDIGVAGPIRVILANTPHGMRVALSGDKPTKLLTGEQVEALIPLLEDALRQLKAERV
jgi:hypothetical protein